MSESTNFMQTVCTCGKAICLSDGYQHSSGLHVCKSCYDNLPEDMRLKRNPATIRFIGIDQQRIASLESELANSVPRSRIEAMEVELRESRDTLAKVQKAAKEEIERLEAELAKATEGDEGTIAIC